MLHLFLLFVLLALFPRALMHAIGCLVWCAIVLVAVIWLFDGHPPTQQPPPPQTRSMIVAHD
jgi:hypothetical protein